jgi:hypothetical protein
MKHMHRDKLAVGVAVTIGLLGVAYGAGYGLIQWDARQKAQTVWAAYPQATDPVEALILQMRDENCPMKERNRAVWALGRLADTKALVPLEQAYTGRPCEHDKFLCQSELEKAICRCGGSIDTENTAEHP